MKLPKDLVAASAVPLVLSILEEGESYGYTIIQRVRELSDGAIEWTDGMLYPVLHRLEAQGLVPLALGRVRGGPQAQVLHPERCRETGAGGAEAAMAGGPSNPEQTVGAGSCLIWKHAFGSGNAR